jgi:hypothetical protein
MSTQAFALFFVFAPSTWPEELVVRVVVVGSPLVLWLVLHSAVWWVMRRTLRRFRCVIGRAVVVVVVVGGGGGGMGSPPANCCH